LAGSRAKQRRILSVSGAEIVLAFQSIPGAWLMELEGGWYAFRNGDSKLGPFPNMYEASEAGLKQWGDG
jgi:hypothetical protein